ncbi:MerR family transcriptional regulator [Paenibacillus soyae]|uniref:MerR family transcriptional regulator n=1 Tax=Paenibacillus soyae TaxID=2969249 RepID=A0A9X2MTN8_9BACL|nr:MerR family transcriptional regulator [Paenibacillus soyae]MCR2806801.1 MerR family transcriptional regulator [Paenibacillus soyae]
MKQDKHYYIKQVAKVTGLSAQLIRKWEERYRLIAPKRLPNGYRLYSEDDVNALLTVKALQKQGHSIAEAALLLKENKRKLDSSFDEPAREPLLGEDQSKLNRFVIALLECGSACNELELAFQLQQAYHFYGLSGFLTEVVSPFLKEVGDRWESGEWDEYQESVSSLVVRDMLVQIRRNYQHNDNAPLVVGACLPMEQHEIPVHFLLLQFLLKGWKTFLIGASPAPGSIEALVSRLKPRIVLLSASTTLPFEHDPDLLAKLDRFAGRMPGTSFYMGGAGALAYTGDLPPEWITIARSIDEVILE